MSESHFVRQARTLFPTIKPKSEPSESESEYVVARALYFYMQEKIGQQSWDEVARIFKFLSDCSNQEAGLWLENAIRVEILEDFDFLGQERKVRSLMGKLMLTWYRTQRDAFKTWSDDDMARRRAEQREFDEDWFGPKRKQKRTSNQETCG